MGNKLYKLGEMPQNGKRRVNGFVKPKTIKEYYLSIFLSIKTKELDCKCNLDRMMVGKSKGQPYYKDERDPQLYLGYRFYSVTVK